jgi:WD40 repeat protein
VSQPRIALSWLSIFLLLSACPAPAQEANEAEFHRIKHGMAVHHVAFSGDGELFPEIENLVKALGSSDFRAREAAANRLGEIGEPALGALHKAITSDDAEIRRRAEAITAAIELKLYGPELKLSGHSNWVYRVSASADGTRLLTCGGDSTLRLLDTFTGKHE